jgi:pilus assembly protein CpaB
MLALVCAGSAAVGINAIMGAKEQTNTVTILVAAEDIPRGKALQENMLKTKSVREEDLREGAVLDKDKQEILLRVASMPFVKGDWIVETKLLRKGARGGPVSLIPPPDPAKNKYYRNVVIKTPSLAAGGAGYIVPGDKVDVLLVMNNQATGAGSSGSTITTLLQNVLVSAVGSQMDAPKESKVDAKEVNEVALIVTTDEAQLLTAGMLEGKLHLTLRNPDDDQKAPTKLMQLVDVQKHQGEVNQKIEQAKQEAEKAATEKYEEKIAALKKQVENLQAQLKAKVETPAVNVTPDSKPSDTKTISVIRGGDVRQIPVYIQGSSGN